MPGDDEGRGDGEGDGEEGRNFNSVEEAKETQATHSQGSMLCSSSNGVAPSIADLDPRVTAAILTQVRWDVLENVYSYACVWAYTIALEDTRHFYRYQQAPSMAFTSRRLC